MRTNGRGTDVSVKSKIRIFPVLLLLAAMGVAAIYVVPMFNKTGNAGDKSVLLTVDFIPVQRNDEVGVTIARTIAGKPEPTFTRRQSPWVETVYAKRGDVISLNPTQHVGGYLRCIISQDSTNHVENERSTIGSLKCRLTVT